MHSKITFFNKPFCITLLAVAFVYGLALPFFWGNDPTSELGTLSLLCENRKLWFWAWGLLTAGSVAVNAQYMYKKFNCKSKILDAFCILSMIGVCCIALTLGHSIEDWNPKRILHWVATGVFIVFLMASVVLFFIFNIKKHKAFPALTVCTFLILATFGILFGVMGKSAIMEMVPIAMLQILLFVVNFTPLVKAE
ncbi:MAG: hypothetical protein IKM24_07355 [Clostridia bacterium]|nr:hypothetical protein [Clostridia bacterium]MBR6780813.1 hypothetical protein [Clostridia bacterium]